MTTIAAPRPVTGSPSERFTSRDPAAYPTPSSDEEEWRFSPLATLRPLLDGTPSTDRLGVEWTVRDGVTILEQASVDDADLPAPADKVAALAGRLAGTTLSVRIAAGVQLSEPVVLTLTGPGADHVVWGRVVVEAGPRSQASVVLTYTGSARYGAQTSVLVGDGAALSLVHVHEWNHDAVHAEHVAARVGRDASYRYTSVSLGGAVVRVVPTVEYAGPGGSASLNGVAYAQDNQHFESRLFVDHAMPQCTSDVLYKNALQGERARTVWIGDVRIRPAAVGTQTFELNRNLLLSAGARADSVPNLEIETGEIAGAGHASATGRFDDLQLFYLQARGIPELEARRLVVRGFFADVVGRIGIPELQDHLMAVIEARLGFTSDELENTAS